MADDALEESNGHLAPVLGEDVVLREKEPLTEILEALPLKAQLGFSALKEKWTNRSDKGGIKQIIAAAKTNDPLKVEYTCLDVSPTTIVFGSNLGIVFLYDRQKRKLSKFNCDQKQIPISCIKLLEPQSFVATGQFSGAVTLFHYGEEKNGIMKVNLKCTVQSHHQVPVTCIQWTPDGTKLFTADSEGNVAITVINMDEGKTHTVFICKEDSPVVQLSFCHTALLISTLRRTLIWPFNTKKIVQVGMQERKAFGNFGACFHPAPGPLPNDEIVDVYAARPGLRLWKATIDGKVLSTMMFRNSINKGLPHIETLELPSTVDLPPQQGEHKQFGPLIAFHDQFIVTYQGSCLWVMDPSTGVVIGCHSNLGCVVDVGISENELFVLSKGKENFVRRIVFEVNPLIVVEELDLNNPNDVIKAQRASSVSQFEDPDRFDKLIDEFGSKMNHALFNVKSKVKGFKEQIRSREVSEDDRGSESDRFSSPKATYKKKKSSLDGPMTSEGYSTGEEKSEDYSKGYEGSSEENNYSDRPFESSNELTNSCELSPEASKQTPKTSEQTLEASEQTPGKLKQTLETSGQSLENSCEPEVVTQTIEVILTHKTREKEPVFSHLSKEDFPKDIVFEGTSAGTPKKKKKKKKTKKKIQESNGLLDPETETSDTHTNGENDEQHCKLNGDATFNENNETNTFARVDSNEKNSISFDNEIETVASEETLTDSVLDVNTPPKSLPIAQITNSKENEIIDEKLCTNNKNIEKENNEPNEEKLPIKDNKDSNTPIMSSLTNMNDSVDFSESITNSVISNETSYKDLSVNVEETIKHNGLLMVATNNDSHIQTEIKEDINVTNLAIQIKHQDSSNSLTDQDDSMLNNTVKEIPNSNNSENSNSLQQHKDIIESNNQAENSVNATSETSNTQHTERLELDDATFNQKLNVHLSTNMPVSDSPSPLPPKTTSIKTTTNQDNNMADMNVVNVKISHKRQGSNVSTASLSERCKEVKGEAIEHNTNRHNLDNTLLLGRDDTLEANMHHHEEELSVVQHMLDDSDDDGKLYPISPFPPPQMTSIYSQRSVSLSEYSLSHQDTTEEDVDDERLLDEMMEYDRIDVQNDLIESIDSITDVEDNVSQPSPSDGHNNDVTGTGVVKRKKRTKTRNSFPSSPSGSDLEGRPVVSSKGAAPESIQERLRYLADSWADMNLPNNCGQIQVISSSANLVWVIDNLDQIYYAPAGISQTYSWKKLDGVKVMQISSNQSGSVVWCVDRSFVAHYRIGIKEGCPQGVSWEPFEKNVHYVAVDKDSVWVIKKNGDVFVRTSISCQRPYGSNWITIKESSDLVQITCMDGIAWALDIYNHVQIFQGDLRTICVTDPSERELSWSELPGITASHINLGSKAVGWIIDRDNGIWFNQDVSRENPSGENWYQLSLGENQSQDTTWFSSILSYFTRGNEPKMIVANEVAGVMILGKQGSVHVAHGHLLGTRWETTDQIQEGSCWTCISAAGADMNKGYVWALQPNGQLICFKSGRQSYNVYPPTRVVLKYCSAGPRSLWALTAGPDVYVRLGISETCPQGLKWLKVDMLAQGNRRLSSICAGNHVVWAVDSEGNAWFQMGREDKKGLGYAPAWVSVEGCPLDGSRFTKIVVGPEDYIVWACDNKNNVYARKDITENFWVGTSWDIVSGTSGKDLAISKNHVWSLCPNGDVLCRFGVSSSNVIGDYWKKVPGNFETISVSANDELWAIDRFGTLYQRETLLFYGSTLSCKAPSYNDLFSDHNDWEFI